MPDLNNTDLVSFEGWTLRVRASTQLSSRLLLLIHGLTGDENSMWVFARDLPDRYWMVAPRAPHIAEQGGYSWRSAESESLNRFSLDQLRAATDGLLRLVDGYAASVGMEVQTFDVLGFSQGAAMSSLLAFLHPERIGRVGILAGFVPGGLDELIPQRPLAGKPFFVVHGTKDQMVPIERARASVKVLEQAGALVTYCEDEVGHKVSVTCLRGLKKFFAE
ncbi:MAG TPA: hypothetical protein VHP14_25220 [Anaerolineales bacterium]|nr:hypothetical protein [Anaerolineales bacterium]